MGRILRNITLCACCLLLALSSAAEVRVPDNEQVLRAVMSSDSPYYYPRLFARYASGDETLSDDDYFYLYYGFMFQKEYRPLENNTAADVLLSVMDDNSLSDEDRNNRMLIHALESFEYDPFSPTNINMLTYIYGLLGDTKNEQINAGRLERVIKTIKSTGNGEHENSPWHVLFFSHSNDIMVFMGKQTARRMVISRTTEYFPLIEKDGKTRGYYFDYSRAYINKPENPQSLRGGFEINGTRIK